jgi:SAM-dependent methyltransferase
VKKMDTPEFTGERYIPGAGGAGIAYEHLHRYLIAARWAQSRSVLDVATGSGYGAALLSRGARTVYAMDIDEGCLRHAGAAWSCANLVFFRGDATQLPLRSESADLVVAMEVLEHLSDQEGLIREIARVCRPGGIAVISTPNRASYSDARDYKNPFHVREFCREELLSLLERHFRHIELLSQQVRAGSLITGNRGTENSCEIITDLAPAGGRAAVEPMYFLAVCGQTELTEPPPLGSAYLDLTDSLILEWERRLQDSNQEIGRLNDEIRELGGWGKQLEETVAERDRVLRQTLDEVETRDRTIAELQQRMQQEIDQRDEHIRRQQADLDERADWARSLEARVADRDALLSEAMDHLARIRHHLLYRLLRRLGLLPD